MEKTPNLATPATTVLYCRMCHQNAETNEGSTSSDFSSTINMASSYDYLKEFYENVSNDPDAKI